MSTNTKLSLLFSILSIAITLFVDTNWVLSGGGNILAFIVWSLFCVSLGFFIGSIVLREDKIDFKKELIQKRIEAINAFKPELQRMVTFEQIGLLNNDKELADSRIDDLSTISALYGVTTTGEHAIMLSEIIEKHGESLTLEQKASLTCLHQLQFHLLELSGALPDEQKDYCFAMLTLPIAQELKEYIRKSIKLLDDSFNKGRYKAEPTYGRRWDRFFDKYNKQTQAMYFSVEAKAKAILYQDNELDSAK